MDEAVSICSLKRFIGDYALRDGYHVPMVSPQPPTGKKISVIGAGPSGLSCAYYLANLGQKSMYMRLKALREAYFIGEFQNTGFLKRFWQKKSGRLRRAA